MCSLTLKHENHGTTNEMKSNAFKADKGKHFLVINNIMVECILRKYF